jgi:ribosomal protein S18 acetylase RimI-like enzyme
MESALELYRGAFVARLGRWARPGQEAWSAPGACGVVVRGEEPFVRLLVTDDRAVEPLGALLAEARTGLVTLCEGADRCEALLRDAPAWQPERPSTAMVRRDLDGLPAVRLPAGLALRPVRRCDGDEPRVEVEVVGGRGTSTSKYLYPGDDVPLEAAIACAAAADSSIDDVDAFAAFLRALPPSLRLHAAVDDGGTVRGTSGCDAAGGDAGVLFVNTDPAWRGRGIASAMTVAALRSAAAAGARRATLDATDVALSLYRRLGFEVAARLVRFRRL